MGVVAGKTISEFSVDTPAANVLNHFEFLVTMTMMMTTMMIMQQNY